MFNTRIKRLREQSGLTQKELSREIGININTLASYEKGSREPNFDTLIKFAKHFDCTTDYLLGLSNAINSEHAKQLEFDDKRIEDAKEYYSNVYFKIGGRRTWDLMVDIISSKNVAHVLLALNDYVEYGDNNNYTTVTPIPNHNLDGHHEKANFLLAHAGMCAEDMFREIRDRYIKNKDGDTNADTKE